MKEPVFIDTSDGKALVADSLKSNKKEEANNIDSEKQPIANTVNAGTNEFKQKSEKIDDSKVKEKTGKL